MDQPVVGRAGLDRNTHLLLGRSVVPIVIYLTRPLRDKPRDLTNPLGAVPGIITVSGTNFCHITARAKFLFPRSQGIYRFVVRFPNGAEVTLDNTNDLRRHDELACFFVPIPTGTTNAVEFVEPASQNQSIRMFGYAASQFPPVQIQSELCHGYITHPDPKQSLGFFRHDCTPSQMSCHGSPLFDDQRRVLGISCRHEGVTRALNMQGIRQQLSKIYELGEMTMFEIMQHIEAMGDANYGNN